MSSSDTFAALAADVSSTLACFLLHKKLSNDKCNKKQSILPCILEQILEESGDNAVFGCLVLEILQPCEVSLIFLLVDIL
jgi:hypothetical protein